uniref:Uncharacterized protein n=1 Tax=Beta vulgaris TaxID=161934 RepID=K4PYU9_BETVU|nr:hypothetical protein [Beta vulgaris]
MKRAIHIKVAKIQKKDKKFLEPYPTIKFRDIQAEIHEHPKFESSICVTGLHISQVEYVWTPLALDFHRWTAESCDLRVFEC